MTHSCPSSGLPTDMPPPPSPPRGFHYSLGLWDVMLRAEGTRLLTVDTGLRGLNTLPSSQGGRTVTLILHVPSQGNQSAPTPLK